MKIKLSELKKIIKEAYEDDGDDDRDDSYEEKLDELEDELTDSITDAIQGVKGIHRTAVEDRYVKSNIQGLVNSIMKTISSRR